MENTIGGRIRGLRGKRTQEDVAKAVGVSRVAISNWERGDTKRLEGGNLMKLARTLRTSPDYILYGRSPAPYPVAPAPLLAPLDAVPVVGTTQGGPPDRMWLDEGYPVGYSDEVLDVPAKDKNAYALRVVGSSMSPRMREGEFIMLYPNQEAQPGDEVVVKTTKGEVMVKALAYIRDGEVALDSIAKDHDRIVRKLKDIEFMHFVAGIHPASALRKQN